MNTGDFVKMRLPGESPWGEVVKVSPDGAALLRIDNKVEGDLSDLQREARLAAMWGGTLPDPVPPRRHGHKYNDLLLCRANEHGLWAPVETEEQGQC